MVPGSLAHSTNTLNDEPTLLQVDLSWFTGEEHDFKALIPDRTSTSTAPMHLTMAIHPKVESHISMTTKVSELLLWAVLDTSCQQLGSSTQKRPVSATLGGYTLLGQKIPPSQWTPPSQASLQVAMPDDLGLIDQTLKEICTPATLPAKTLGPGTGVLLENMVQPQKEVNKALEHLLATRSSLDAHCRKCVSDFEMALHQNESKATEAITEAKKLCGSTIREAKACHTTLIREAEAQHATLIREAKANCASIITEAEACCTTAIRKVESCCAEHACSIQQLHAEGMQHLEMEAIKEEGRDHLSFLATCGTALHACPLEAHGVPIGPLQLLMGNVPLATLLNIPPRYLPLKMNPLSWPPIQLPPGHPGPLPGPNGDTLPPIMRCPHLDQETRL